MVFNQCFLFSSDDAYIIYCIRAPHTAHTYVHYMHYIIIGFIGQPYWFDSSDQFSGLWSGSLVCLKNGNHINWTEKHFIFNILQCTMGAVCTDKEDMYNFIYTCYPREFFLLAQNCYYNFMSVHVPVNSNLLLSDFYFLTPFHLHKYTYMYMHV